MKIESNPWEPARWSAPKSEWNDPLLPMVTLGVLNYNRCKELRQTLDILTNGILYPNYEIIVVDNGSTDGSLEMIRSEFPHVRIFEVGYNAGVLARNFLTPIAQGKYLFHFDDDTCPGTPSTILRIVQHLEQFPDIDALSTSYYQPISGLMETEGWEAFRMGGNSTVGFDGGYIVEGGVCFRLEAYRRLPGYDSAWKLGQEGMELGLQLLKAGCKVCFCPWFLTLHFISRSVRAGGRSYRAHRAYVNSRQSIWMIAKHWPILIAVPLLMVSFSRRILAMIMHRETWKENMRGIIDGYKGIKPFFDYTPKFTRKQAIQLKKFYLFFFRWA